MNRWTLGSIIAFGSAIFELSLASFIHESPQNFYINLSVATCLLFVSFLCYLFGRAESADDIFNQIDDNWKFVEHTKYGALYVCLTHENHYRINPKEKR